MCHYNGVKVSRAQYIRLKTIEKELRNVPVNLNIPVRKGFDYKDWPIIKPLNEGTDIEIQMTHWEYIPEFVSDEHDLVEARKRFTWLNARGEYLFVNDKGKLSVYREGAETGRCLVLSSYFFEAHHKDKIGKIGKYKGQVLQTTDNYPYCITLKEEPEYFFMAGVYRKWTNWNRNQSADTFAIVTAPANEMMHEIHNTEHRMPVILTEDMAFEWIQPGLSKERIMEIASFQYPADKMKAWTVAKDYYKSPDPTKKYHYPGDINLPVFDDGE